MAAVLATFAMATPVGQAEPPTAEAIPASPANDAGVQATTPPAAVPTYALSAAARRAKDAAPAVPAAPQAVQPPTDNQETLGRLWRERNEHLAAGDVARAGQTEETIRTVGDELGIDNLLTPAMALVREAGTLLRQGRSADALSRCRLATSLAPAWSGGYACVARATLAGEPSAVGAILSALDQTVTLSLNDVRSRRDLIADAGFSLLLALALACVALILLIVLRNCRLSLHDFHHLFPARTPWTLTTLMALGVAVLPLLVGAGVFVTLAIAILTVTLFASRADSIALGLALLLLAGVSYGVAAVERASVFGPDAQAVYLLERADMSATAAARLEAGPNHGLDHYATAFALGRYYKRLGQYARAKEAYDAALALHPSAELLNDAGNLAMLQGDSDTATKDYIGASQQNPRLAAPLWNIARIYFKEARMELGAQAIKAARELDPARASKMVGLDDLRANQYLVDTPLPDDAILAAADREGGSIPAGAVTARLLLPGATPEELAGAALVVALLIRVLRWRRAKIQPSTRCERCGRPVCSRCDPELRFGAGLCGQCISVFVRKSGVDIPDRVRKELEVREFRRRRRIATQAAGVVIGGGGHLLSGRVAAGAFFLFLFCLLVTRVVFWHGFVRDPAVAALPPFEARIVLYAAGFLALFAVSLVHLVRTEEPD